MKIVCTLIFAVMAFQLSGQVNVTVDLSKQPHRVSPYLYGRNNSLSGNPGSGFTPEWTRLKDAKVRFFREGGGNNSTKYNWRLKLSSHPDWYNNVYANDWDYNTSKWWDGVAQNLAGGGVVNPAGGADAVKEGNPDLYLQNWTADSTVNILNHWFNDLALDKKQLVYWNMDNEPEIWNGTHDDVMPTQLPAEEFMQRYFDVAKKARATYPEIKLVGPVPANEWQWYNWPDGITQGGKKYPWLEYFIKRVAEEQKASGVRLLDVLDIHFYPGSTKPEEVVQFHRVYFDKNYVFPEANGVKNVTGTWDNTQNKEYIFERCKAWLNQYMGEGHGVTFSVSETGISSINPGTSAVWYASTLGEFMKHPEMEFFTPWTWQPGMWEVLHLFSAYNKDKFVSNTSSDEELVSAYPTLNEGKDSITLVLVNRSVNQTKTANVSFKGFVLNNESFETLKLSNLPASETFDSHTTNALQKSASTPLANVLTVSLPPMSVTSVLLRGREGEVVTATEKPLSSSVLKVYPNPVSHLSEVTIEIRSQGKAVLHLLDASGKQVLTILEENLGIGGYKNTVSLRHLPKGLYILQLSVNGRVTHRKISKPY